MMKRVFCLLLAACMAVSLCACGKDSEKGAENDTPISDTKSPASTSEVIPTPGAKAVPDAPEQEQEESEQAQTSADGVDVDLTVLSSTMVYSEVYNMLYYDQESYYGKTVKADGVFAIYQMVVDGVTQPDPVAYACIIADATACCAEGMEFVLEGDLSYPDEYPELGAEITVIGEFQPYEENGMTWYHLINARMV